MKKIVSLLVSVLLVAALAVTAFAAPGSGTNDGTTTQSIDVQAVYTGDQVITEIVSATIEWGAMEFTYNATGTKTWQPATHTYSGDATSSWSASGNTVKVTNHSNVAVGVEVTFAADAEFADDVTGSWENGTANLAAGVENQPDAADSVTATLTLGGSLPNTQTTMGKVGTITVTITK